jgi:predicted peptidase
MHDASISGHEVTATLTQGVGATIWATPEEQAKHPCFVVAPQYPVQITNDQSQTNEYLDITVDLIHQIAKEYSVNTNKMYTTGQSGGCMMSIALDIKYPDLFAASMLVAGQWDASLGKTFGKTEDLDSGGRRRHEGISRNERHHGDFGEKRGEGEPRYLERSCHSCRVC